MTALRLAVAVTALVASAEVARAEPISPDVQSWADWVGLDAIELQGAVNTTGLHPEDYLVATGIVAPLPTPTTPTPRSSASSIAAYITSHSRYGARATCVSRIETGSWTAYWNPQGWPPPYYNEHAQGYFGWLPSTARSVELYAIMDLDEEIAAFDRMLDRGRGREFYGISAEIC